MQRLDRVGDRSAAGVQGCEERRGLRKGTRLVVKDRWAVDQSRALRQDKQDVLDRGPSRVTEDADDSSSVECRRAAAAGRAPSRDTARPSSATIRCPCSSTTFPGSWTSRYQGAR